MHIGRDIAEVAHNLLVLGKMYEFRMDDDDFYRFDRVHSVLSAVYNGAYPISEILAKVSIPPRTPNTMALTRFHAAGCSWCRAATRC